jgi:hypothetical protein
VKRKDIERFFAALAKAWPHRTECILIGGAAAVLEGSSRPTSDVDFEVRFGGAVSAEDPDAFAGAVREAESVSGISGQFSEDIAGWSPIALPPYRNTARLWKSFGPISVRLLEPAVYVLTKLRRGTADDFADLLVVARRNRGDLRSPWLRTTGLAGARRHRVPWRRLSTLCASSVRSSPRSTRLLTFTRRVEYLFNRHGRDIWGPAFDPLPAIKLFQRQSSVPR